MQGDSAVTSGASRVPLVVVVQLHSLKSDPTCKAGALSFHGLWRPGSGMNAGVHMYAYNDGIGIGPSVSFVL